LFKIALPSMIQNPKGNKLISSANSQNDEWPPLQFSSISQARTENSTLEMAPATQTSNFELDFSTSDRMFIQNGKLKAWFHPSRGLNVLFKWAGPKPDGMKPLAHSLQNQNPSCNSIAVPLSHQKRFYVEVLKMDAGGNSKGSGSGRREDEECNRAPAHGGQSSGGNPGDWLFNPIHNGQLRYNPGHNTDRAYEGYARGWQRQQHPSYCFVGSRMNDRARAGQPPVQNSHRSNQLQPQRT
jgi:hypothetical protein